jgi:oligopeptide transport system permease protein
MWKYTARKFLMMVFTLFIIATATFFLVNAIPGDPLGSRLINMPKAVAENMYAKYGLDKPLLERYFITMTGMLRGDFGMSVVFEGDTVQSILGSRLHVTLQLGFQQMALGIVLGLLLGIISARKNGKLPDYLIIAIAIFLVSVPPLVFSLLLQKVFSGGATGLPIIGWGSFKHTILPTLAGCFTYISFYARLMKSSMLDASAQDYILTAQSKGLSKTGVITKHTLRNSFIPILTYLPMSVAMCITGSFFIESVFSIPGLGYYFVNAVSKRDTSIVMGLTVFLSALYLLAVFVTDILYKLADPRIRINNAKER